MIKTTAETVLAAAAAHAASFRKRLDSLPQHARKTHGDMVQIFREPLPAHGGDAHGVIDELVTKAEPGLQFSAGRRFFAWVIGSSHPAGVAADWLTSAWGQNAGNHIAAPAAAAVETIAAEWLLQLLGLPRQSSIGFVTGATVANFTCLAAARGEVLRQAGWDADAQGLFGAPPVTVVIGDDAHATVFSALQFLGLGHDRVTRVATDDQGRIIPAAFATALAGVSGPCIVILQAGQINTGGFDPFAEIIPLAKAKGAWVHVDGAFGLWAAAAPARRALCSGVALADSWATDGHKWLQAPYDSGFAIVRDEVAHRRAMTVAASYLPLTAEGERDPSHYVPELSRRARGFAVWAIIKTLGESGIAEMVERNCRVAARVAEILAREAGVRIGNDVVLNQAIARFGADEPPERGDQITADTIAMVQKEGTCYVGSARWRGRLVMRFSVSGGETTEDDGERSAAAIIACYRKALNGA